jgi:hypothetical protein
VFFVDDVFEFDKNEASYAASTCWLNIILILSQFNNFLFKPTQFKCLLSVLIIIF